MAEAVVVEATAAAPVGTVCLPSPSALDVAAGLGEVVFEVVVVGADRSV
jgi:hypothetical protein